VVATILLVMGWLVHELVECQEIDGADPYRVPAPVFHDRDALAIATNEVCKARVAQ